MTAKKINVIGYRDIAAKLGVSVKYIHNLASTGEMSDPDFPQPTTPGWMRSPGFDEDDVDRWIALRAARAQRGKSGRPPALGYTRIQVSPDVNKKILQRIRKAGTFREFTELAGISDQALRTRFTGRTRWRSVELEAFATRLNTTVEELTAEPLAGELDVD